VDEAYQPPTPVRPGELRVRVTSNIMPSPITTRPLEAGSGVEVVPEPGPEPGDWGGQGENGPLRLLAIRAGQDRAASKSTSTKNFELSDSGE